jgi:hypothetical protein
MPLLPTGQAYPGTETVMVRISTFVSHFLASLILVEHKLPKVMIQLIVPVPMKQVLLLECKPMVD